MAARKATRRRRSSRVNHQEDAMRAIDCPCGHHGARPRQQLGHRQLPGRARHRGRPARPRIEPEPTLRARAGEAATTAPVSVRVLGAVADELPLEDESVHTAVASLVFGSVPDQDRALAELQPGAAPRRRAALLRARHPTLPAQATAPTSGRPQRPVAPHRRRLSPGPRHRRRHRARRLRNPDQRAHDVRRLSLRAQDPHILGNARRI
jgi:methyltransferase family protein